MNDRQGLLIPVEHICVLAVITYFVARTKAFAKILAAAGSRTEKLLTFTFFSFLAVAELAISHGVSFANTRTVSSTAAGLLGGPVVGFGVGTVTALASVAAGRTSAGAEGLAAIVGGLIDGRFRCVT